jgi:hypothetical protein
MKKYRRTWQWNGRPCSHLSLDCSVDAHEDEQSHTVLKLHYSRSMYFLYYYHVTLIYNVSVYV